MAPCFSRVALDELMETTFLLTACTWGIDYAWSSLLLGQGRLSVVDAVAMHHTKPMDRARGPFYKMLRQRGIDPDDELAAVHRHMPPWGEMQTESEGHHYRWHLPGRLSHDLTDMMESYKIALHLARGGTIASQRPLMASADVTLVG
jgi:hypothetical protein